MTNIFLAIDNALKQAAGEVSQERLSTILSYTDVLRKNYDEKMDEWQSKSDKMKEDIAKSSTISKKEKSFIPSKIGFLTFGLALAGAILGGLLGGIPLAIAGAAIVGVVTDGISTAISPPKEDSDEQGNKAALKKMWDNLWSMKTTSETDPKYSTRVDGDNRDCILQGQKASNVQGDIDNALKIKYGSAQDTQTASQSLFTQALSWFGNLTVRA